MRSRNRKSEYQPTVPPFQLGLPNKQGQLQIISVVPNISNLTPWQKVHWGHWAIGKDQRAW